jgi:hypothetical protein
LQGTSKVVSSEMFSLTLFSTWTSFSIGSGEQSFACVGCYLVVKVLLEGHFYLCLMLFGKSLVVSVAKTDKSLLFYQLLFCQTYLVMTV